MEGIKENLDDDSVTEGPEAQVRDGVECRWSGIDVMASRDGPVWEDRKWICLGREKENKRTNMMAMLHIM